MLQGRRYTFNLKNKKTPTHPTKPPPNTQKKPHPKPPRKHTKNTPKTHRSHSDTIPIPFRRNTDTISKPFRSHPKTAQTPPKNRPKTAQIPPKYHPNTTQIPPKYRPKTAQTPPAKPYFSFSTLSFFTLPIFTHLGRSRRLKMCGVTPFPPTNALHPGGGHPLFFLAEYALPLLSTACHS